MKCKEYIKYQHCLKALTTCYLLSRYKKQKRVRAMQRKATKAKCHLEIATFGGYPSGYYFKEDRVVRGSRGRASKHLKKLGNRKVRRVSNDDISTRNKGYYKKHFDYWWELT